MKQWNKTGHWESMFHTQLHVLEIGTRNFALKLALDTYSLHDDGLYIGRGYSVAGYKISYSVATSIYDNFIY